MKPYHATTTKKRTHISRCPCCAGKYRDCPRPGKKRARREGRNQIKDSSND